MSLHHGDCLDVMAGMEPESVDAVVTDPPYGLEFMGKEWDKLRGRTSHEVTPFDPQGKPSIAQRGGTWQPGSSYGSPQRMPKCGKCGKWKYNGWKPRQCSCAEPAWVTDTSTYPRRMGEWHQQWAEAAFRVAKPSAYLLAFGGTRTVHRMTSAIEDAGWIIRDMLVWAYASGFPKSKASLKPAWEPIAMARKPGPLRMLAIDATRLPTGDRSTSQDGSGSNGAYNSEDNDPWHTDGPPVRSSSKALRAWSAARLVGDSARLANALADAFLGRGLLSSQGGYPSCPRCGDGLARISAAVDLEDARRPPDAPDVLQLRGWSVSRIRESRCADHLSTWDELARVVAGEEASAYGNDTSSGRERLVRPAIPRTDNAVLGNGLGAGVQSEPLGRWPANVILTDPIFDGGWEGVVGGGETASGSRNGQYAGSASWSGEYGPVARDIDGDSGTYSRFFLIPKADRADREPVLGGLPERALTTHGTRAQGPLPQQTPQGPIRRANHHPTVKPVDLMRHLVRLVTPTGGTVLDPFAGSGSTLIAAEMEGFDWIGIEKEAEYVAIAEARLNGTQRGLGLPA